MKKDKISKAIKWYEKKQAKEAQWFFDQVRKTQEEWNAAQKAMKGNENG